MKRRAENREQDSFDLLLDTVSNVFGGVMFLTLLAALLILSRGVTPESDTAVDVVVDMPTDTTLIDAEIRQTAAALETQQRINDRLDPDGTAAAKSMRLESLRETIALAKRNVSRARKEVESREQSQSDQQSEQSDLQQQVETLAERVAENVRSNRQVRAQSERSVEFRGLSRSMTAEAVVVLRYGRWYLLQTGKNGRYLNSEDFFIRQDSGVHRITPKPHKGQTVDEASLEELMAHLRGYFSPKYFHVVIAVWDDSFAEFNPLKDAVKEAGFQYRTLPCDSSSRLSNQSAADAYVQ